MATTDKARRQVVEVLRKAATASPEARHEIQRVLKEADIGNAICRGDLDRAASSLAQLATGAHVPTGRKVLDYTLYDTDALTNAGTQNRNFFTSLTYQSGPLQGQDKGPATSMEAEGLLLRPKRHEAIGIKWEVLPKHDNGDLPSLADLLLMRANLYVVLYQGKRPVRRIKWGLSSGPGVQVIANAASTLQAAQLGSASGFDFLRFGELRFRNNSDEPFRVQIASSPDYATSDPVLIRMSLAGVLQTTAA